MRQVKARKPGGEIDCARLESCLGYVLRCANQAVSMDVTAAFAAADLRPAQYTILTLIESNPGSKQSQIADALRIKKTNFVTMIDDLERCGLVRRVPSNSDRRSLGLYLTEAGVALMPKLHAIAEAHTARIRDQIGAQTYRDLFAPLAALVELPKPTLTGSALKAAASRRTAAQRI